MTCTYEFHENCTTTEYNDFPVTSSIYLNTKLQTFYGYVYTILTSTPPLIGIIYIQMYLEFCQWVAIKQKIHPTKGQVNIGPHAFLFRFECTTYIYRCYFSNEKKFTFRSHTYRLEPLKDLLVQKKSLQNKNACQYSSKCALCEVYPHDKD